MTSHRPFVRVGRPWEGGHIAERTAHTFRAARLQTADPGIRGAMPEHWEYVFAAYGIWIAVFFGYWVHLLRKSRSLGNSLRQLSQQGGDS